MKYPTSNCGIYQFRNIVTDKVYIGSSKHIRIRKAKHISNLRAGKHHSKKLQHSWNKYGEAAFTFEILAICPEKYLLKLEQWFLDCTQAVTNGYNICPNASNCLGIKRSAEHKKKISKANLGVSRNKGHKQTEEHLRARWKDNVSRNSTYKLVHKTTSEVLTIKGILEVATLLECNVQNVYRNLKGQVKTTRNYYITKV